MSERDIIKIAVTPGAKSAIEATGERYGMSQIELASRVYAWFAEQDEVVQAAILGILPTDLAPDVARLVLERLSTDPRTPGSGGPGSGGAPGSGSTQTTDASPPRRRAAKPARRAIHVTKKPTDPPKPSPPPRDRRS